MTLKWSNVKNPSVYVQHLVLIQSHHQVTIDLKVQYSGEDLSPNVVP